MRRIVELNSAVVLKVRAEAESFGIRLEVTRLSGTNKVRWRFSLRECVLVDYWPNTKRWESVAVGCAGRAATPMIALERAIACLNELRANVESIRYQNEHLDAIARQR